MERVWGVAEDQEKDEGIKCRLQEMAKGTDIGELLEIVF